MAENNARPPQPPSIAPRLRMRTAEVVGMSIVAIVPVLASFGLLGPKIDRVSAQSQALDLEVEYPAVLRQNDRRALTARVGNRSDQVLEHVDVAFGHRYLSAFTGVSFVPSAGNAYTVRLSSLRPGESRLVVVEFEAERYGRHRGRIAALHGAQEAAVELRTLTLP